MTAIIKKSLWDLAPQRASFIELNKNLKTDVCIVGAGITGLTTAYLLMLQEKQVTVVDKAAGIGFGETGASTAHMTWVLDDRAFTLRKIQGSENAKLAFQSHREAIDRMENILRETKIDADFQRLDGYLFSGKDQKINFLEKELQAFQKLEIMDVFEEKNGPPGADFGPCLKFPQQAQFHPLKYLHGLAELIQKKGGQIMVNALAQHIEEEKTQVKVIFENGLVITAKDIVMACHVPFEDKRSFMFARQAPYRSYVVAGKVPKNAVTKALYWDTEDPYHYIRLWNDFLIVGGEDHKTGQLKKGVDPHEKLLKWVTKKFPMMKDEEIYRWSGQIMEPSDRLAFIGVNPGNEHVYVATGYSGNGTTCGLIAAQLITDLIFWKENPYKKIYDPGRIKLKGAKEFLKDNAIVAEKYFQKFIKRKEPSLKNMESGSGVTISKSGQKMAIFKDDAGKIYACSATCPHMGCDVEWNPIEKTWDCPCHGSRYDPRGKLLNGPSRSALKPLPREELDDI